METISYTLPPEQDGATVRHILKAALHVSSHAISRLTRTENGIRVNGIHARTVDILHTGDVLEVETSDHRPPRVRPTPGPWPLPIVWEDGHLLVVNKPAGMTAHASNFLPDTPTVAGALDAYGKGEYHRFYDGIYDELLCWAICAPQEDLPAVLERWEQDRGRAAYGWRTGPVFRGLTSDGAGICVRCSGSGICGLKATMILSGRRRTSPGPWSTCATRYTSSPTGITGRWRSWRRPPGFVKRD